MGGVNAKRRQRLEHLLNLCMVGRIYPGRAHLRTQMCPDYHIKTCVLLVVM